MFTGLESPAHLIIVLVVVLLLFGAKRIPELARGLGAGGREFKKGTKGRRNRTRPPTPTRSENHASFFPRRDYSPE